MLKKKSRSSLKKPEEPKLVGSIFDLRKKQQDCSPTKTIELDGLSEFIGLPRQIRLEIELKKAAALFHRMRWESKIL